MIRRRRIVTVVVAFSAMLAAALHAQTTAADYFKQGNQHFNNAEWDQAIASFQSALKVDPTYSDAQLVLSLCYLLDGKLELARAGAIKYESMKPEDPGGYVAQSQAASGLNLYAEAVQAAQTAIRLKPDKSNLAAAYFQLGYNQYLLGKTSEANQAYQTLKTIDTDSAQSLYTAIQRLEAKKRPTSSPGGAGTSPASKPVDPARTNAASSAQTKTAALPELPDLPAARTAIQSADLIKADDLTLTDVIFILQYRDASTSNQAAAKKVWSEVLDKEKNGEPLQISNAMVISSTKTTVELALSDDCKHAKEADTHLILAKSMSAPARAGVVTNISGVITSYKTNPFMLTIERGELLSANSAASTVPSPSTSTRTAASKPAPESTQSATAPSAPAKRVDGWITYGNSEGNFTALLPNQPKVTPNAAEQGQVSNTIQSLTNDGVAYTVVYVRNGEAQPVDEQTFQLYRDNFLKSVPTCSVLAESAASPEVQGLVGRAYRLNCVINGVNMTMTGDLYWGRRYAYAVFAMFGPMVSDPAEARKFVDSFKVIDPSK